MPSAPDAAAVVVMALDLSLGGVRVECLPALAMGIVDITAGQLLPSSVMAVAFTRGAHLHARVHLDLVRHASALCCSCACPGATRFACQDAMR